MRNPDRLDDFYEKLKELHKTYLPDWRFGQLVNNFYGWMCTKKKVDMFFPEESKMIEYLEEFVKGMVR